MLGWTRVIFTLEIAWLYSKKCGLTENSLYWNPECSLRSLHSFWLVRNQKSPRLLQATETAAFSTPQQFPFSIIVCLFVCLPIIVEFCPEHVQLKFYELLFFVMSPILVTFLRQTSSFTIPNSDLCCTSSARTLGFIWVPPTCTVD